MYSTTAVALLMYLYFAIVPVLAHGRKRTILCCVYKITNKHPQQKRTKRISIMNRSESAKDKTLKRKRKEEKVQRLHQLADFFLSQFNSFNLASFILPFSLNSFSSNFFLWEWQRKKCSLLTFVFFSSKDYIINWWSIIIDHKFENQ